MNEVRELSREIYLLNKNSRKRNMSEKVRKKRDDLIAERERLWLELYLSLIESQAPEDIIYIVRQHCLHRKTWTYIASQLYIDLQFNPMMPIRRLDRWIKKRE